MYRMDAESRQRTSPNPLRDVRLRDHHTMHSGAEDSLPPYTAPRVLDTRAGASLRSTCHVGPRRYPERVTEDLILLSQLTRAAVVGVPR